MKKCYTCQTLKEESEFNKNKGRNDGLNSICRQCSGERSRQYYSENKELHKKNIGINKAKYKAKLRTEIDILKSKGCHFCSEKEPVCMDFHHINPDKKEYLVSRLIGMVSKRKLKKEIDKCIIVCSNCHRKLHAGLIKLSGV